MGTIRLTMAQALVKFLDNQYLAVDDVEIKFVEGIIGIFGHGCVVGLGEALEEKDHQLKFYQGHNEQGMAHVAIAFAKQHKRQKILAVTSSIGPGALNMVTAAGTATVNRIPVLFLPGDIFACRQPDPVLQQIEQFYDVNITANDAFKAVTKYWDRIIRPEQLMTAAINAMRVLTDPAETGAVCLCLPQDVQAEAIDYPLSFFKRRVHRLTRRPLEVGATHQATELILGKQKPMLICGGGVRYSDAGSALAAFAEKFNIPFCETQAGKGVIPWHHPLNMGAVGVTGTLAANEISHQSDLVIAVGTRLNDFHTASKWNFHNPQVELLSINVSNFDAYKMDAEPLLADAREALEAIAEMLSGQDYQSKWGEEAKALRDQWINEVDRIYSHDNGGGYAQTRVIGQLNNGLIAEDAIVVAASGSLPSDLERLWRVTQPDTYHLEYGFSCMGYEVSGALGAKLAAPDREVYCLVGDGGYLMLHSEIVTAIQEGIKINVILFNNHGFDCIDNLQISQGIPHFGCQFRYRTSKSDRLEGEVLPIDFAMNAQSYGCQSWSVSSAEAFEVAFKEAKNSPVSTLIEVHTAPKSMTHGYSTWWRVGTPEVSPKKAVVNAAKEMKKDTVKAKLF
ncbi:MAG: 3D-(3,5/4)-trihydroxycyclohexane-1,2-dione acylhydrolase (decyclizing) [Desulfobacteraceae bacterium]|nr:3D-(3,5/4)-trihydroxycyclohexane-1,2-dione acylhydrolase (decyclizing) [Desulfobacteraceae bacterium]